MLLTFFFFFFLPPQEKLAKSIHYLISKEDQVRTQITELEVLINKTEVRELTHAAVSLTSFDVTVCSADFFPLIISCSQRKKTWNWVMVIASSLRFFDCQSAHKMSISTIPTLSSAKSLDSVKSIRSRRWLTHSLTYLLKMLSLILGGENKFGSWINGGEVASGRPCGVKSVPSQTCRSGHCGDPMRKQLKESVTRDGIKGPVITIPLFITFMKVLWTLFTLLALL